MPAPFATGGLITGLEGLGRKLDGTGRGVLRSFSTDAHLPSPPQKFPWQTRAPREQVFRKFYAHPCHNPRTRVPYLLRFYQRLLRRPIIKDATLPEDGRICRRSKIDDPERLKRLYF